MSRAPASIRPRAANFSITCAICAIGRARTIVLTTHHMEEAERCDRIGVLHQGRLVAIAPPADLERRTSAATWWRSTRAHPTELREQDCDADARDGRTGVTASLRVERPRGHEFVRDVVDVFGDEIESVTFGKPTLEDVFVHLTGQRFRRERGGSNAMMSEAGLQAGTLWLREITRFSPAAQPRYRIVPAAAGFLGVARAPG